MPPRATTRSRAPSARLRAFGHRFLLDHKRLPTAAEVATALRLTGLRTEALLASTHSPVCADDVACGALPRLRVGGAAIEPAMAENLAEQTRRVIATLTPVEEAQLRMRFGIGVKADAVPEEVTQDIEVTRQRIRPIEASTLRKLRHPSTQKRLRRFLVED